jgi:hypothetical protein
VRLLRIASCAFSAGLAVGACTGNGWFRCKADSECVAQDDGRCEPDDRCSYPDVECDSQRRYGEWAGELSRECVEGTTDTTTGGPSDSSSTTLVEATTTTTTTPESSSGTSTTDASTSSTSGSETTGGTPPQPIGHWPLDDGEDSVTATDIGSGNHAGALVGGTWIEGRIGTGALQLDESPDGVVLGDDPDFAMQDASGITMMGWARFDEFATNAALIAKQNSYSIRFWGDVETGFAPNVIIDPDGATGDGDTDGPLDPYGQIVCGNPTKLLLSGAATPEEDATIWHHYAGTYDVEGRWLRLYVDGELVCEKDVSADMLDGPVAVTDYGLQLGRWRPSGDTLVGAIDDLRLYDVVLSAEDIATIANELE